MPSWLKRSGRRRQAHSPLGRPSRAEPPRRTSYDWATSEPRRPRRHGSRYADPSPRTRGRPQLTFGTWRFLLPDRDPGRQRLWLIPCTGPSPIFRAPGRPSSPRLTASTADVTASRTLSRYSGREWSETRSTTSTRPPATNFLTRTQPSPMSFLSSNCIRPLTAGRNSGNYPAPARRIPWA